VKRLGIVGKGKVDDLGLGQGYPLGPEAFPGLKSSKYRSIAITRLRRLPAARRFLRRLPGEVALTFAGAS